MDPVIAERIGREAVREVVASLASAVAEGRVPDYWMAQWLRQRLVEVGLDDDSDYHLTRLCSLSASLFGEDDDA